MIRTLLALAVLYASLGLTLSSVDAAQNVVNGTGKVWQVRYDNSTKNRRGDAGLRLKIKQPNASSPEITATLIRYDQAVGGKYRRQNFQGLYTLTGRIVANEKPGNSRKSEYFILTGTHFVTKPNEPTIPHLIVLQGKFSTGSDGKAQGEGDNFLTVRISDKILTPNASHWMLPGFLTGLLLEPCDDVPPDDDVLMEEPIDPNDPNDDNVNDEANDPTGP